MVAVHAAPAEETWLYGFDPSMALPTVDLSESLKSRYLPPALLQAFDAFLWRWRHPLVIMYAASLVLTSIMLYIEAKAGQLAAVLTVVLGFPLGIGSLGALRFEMVVLLLREDSVVFFGLLTVVTQVLIVILLGDLRALYLINFFIGFISVMLIDARLRAIRMFTNLCMASALVIFACLAAFVLQRVDHVNDIPLWQFREGDTVYDVCLSEYVTTGLSTLLILFAKIVFRKFQSLHSAARTRVIECMMFQRRVRLMPRPHGGPSAHDLSPQGHLDSPSPMQQLILVRSGQVYDSRMIVVPILLRSSKAPFPWLFLMVLYGLGALGFGLFLSSSFYGADSIETANYILTPIAVMFTSSLVFWLTFAAFYQRDLLRSLVFSFDLLFYSSQLTTALLASARLGQWEQNQCLWLATAWIWTHWIFCVDTLTPVIRAKLRFHVWYAVPILFLQILGAAKLVFETITTIQDVPEGSILWSGRVFGRNATLHLLPLVVSRILLASTWMMRMLLRLCTASNADTFILRGAVSYENYLSRGTHTRQRITSRISSRGRQSVSTLINPTIPKLLPMEPPRNSLELRAK